MRKSIKLLAVAAVATAALLGTTTPALAQPSHTTAVRIVGNIHQTSATTATVRAQYTCTGAAEQTHVWISVKQNASRTADPALATEGSGSGMVASAWSQTHAATLTCDGRQHLGAFTVDHAEQGYGTLGRGVAYMQFCLFDMNYQQQPLSVDGFFKLR